MRKTLLAAALTCASIIAVQADATTYVRYTISTVGTAREFSDITHAYSTVERWNVLQFDMSSDGFYAGNSGFFYDYDTGSSSAYFDVYPSGLSLHESILTIGMKKLTFFAPVAYSIDGLPYLSGGLESAGGSYSYDLSPHDGGFINEIASVTSVSTQFSDTAFSSRNTLSQISKVSVPEPATWAMFIGGFGLVGATMRRNRRIAVSFA